MRSYCIPAVSVTPGKKHSQRMLWRAPFPWNEAHQKPKFGQNEVHVYGGYTAIIASLVYNWFTNGNI